MSNALLTAVFEQSNTRNAARLLMLTLADRADNSGTCWPSIADLMRRTGLSKAAIFAATRQAVALGELLVEPYRGPNHTHRYTVQNLNGSESKPFRIKTDTVQNIDIYRSESEPKPSLTLNNPQSLARVAKLAKPKSKTNPGADAEFQQFWSAYPRKTGKAAAVKAWSKTAKERPLLAVLLAAIEQQEKSSQWQNPDYIPYPATWLNGHRWDDELPAAAASATAVQTDF